MIVVRPIRWATIWPFVAGLATTATAASGAAAQVAQSAHVRATLSRWEAGASGEWTGALTLAVASGWHISAPAPGTTGLPTTLHPALAPGWALHQVQWPEPVQRIRGRDTTYEYEGDAAVRLRLVAPTSAVARARHQLGVSFGACREVCIPERVELTFVTPRQP